MKVFASVVIDAPVEKIWPILRDFIGLTVWSPAVKEASITNDKASDQVGAIRRLDIVDGSAFVETLVALSDEEMYLKYNIVEGPVPVTDYVATMQLQPVTEGNMTYATWSAEFDAPDEHTEAMRKVIGRQICAGGLKAMKAHFEGE
ncbi:MAG: SRPBCC family protein [Chloroflexota bacterium]